MLYLHAEHDEYGKVFPFVLRALRAPALPARERLTGHSIRMGGHEVKTRRRKTPFSPAK
jgi:hypothetical protein